MQSNREVFQEIQEQEAKESPEIEREEELEPVKVKRTILDIRSDAHIEAINRRKRQLYKNIDFTKKRERLDFTILDENGIYHPTDEEKKEASVRFEKHKETQLDEWNQLRENAKLRKIKMKEINWLDHNHEAWVTCNVCGFQYDLRLDEDCPKCNQK